VSIGSDNSLPWFAIQTKLRREKDAAAQLEFRGYDVYLPLYKKHNRWSDRMVEVECPLFPGYLFCRVDCSRPFPIVTVSGVLSIVGRGRQPESIPEHEILAVDRMLQSGLLATPYPYLQEGERVMIVKGPLCGVDGLVVRNKSKCKVIVSINLLQRSVAVELDYDAVREDFETNLCNSQSPSRGMSAGCS
jgi:transcription antitermination factor NusG